MLNDFFHKSPLCCRFVLQEMEQISEEETPNMRNIILFTDRVSAFGWKLSRTRNTNIIRFVFTDNIVDYYLESVHDNCEELSGGFLTLESV